MTIDRIIELRTEKARNDLAACYPKDALKILSPNAAITPSDLPKYLYYVARKADVDDILDFGLSPKSSRKLIPAFFRLYFTARADYAIQFVNELRFLAEENVQTLRISTLKLKNFIGFYEDNNFTKNGKIEVIYAIFSIPPRFIESVDGFSKMLLRHPSKKILVEA